MRKLIYLLALWAPITSAQCDAVITNFNWETYTATIDVDCEEGLTDICLYLGNAELDDIPPCGNFSQNINWPEYTFTFFNNLNVTQGTIELNIFDAWNNAVANPYTIAECWVQYYEEGFFCEGEVGIWQMNLGGNLLGYSSIEFGGPCPGDCDPIIEYVDVIEYLTDTITIIETDTITIYELDTITLYEIDTIYNELVVYEYIYQVDTITEYHTLTQYIDCETGLPCSQNECDETTIYAPNAVTPNGDGWNDTWQVIADNCWDMWEVRIYNRWGGLVWISTSSLDEWDANVATGVYVYTIKAIKYNPMEVYEMNGYVTVFY